MSDNKCAPLSVESGKHWKFTSSMESRISLKWKVKTFLQRQQNRAIWSPSFTFLSSEWSVGLIHCNIFYDMTNEILVYLRMQNPKSETKVKCEMRLKDTSGYVHCVKDFEFAFSVEKNTYTGTLIDEEMLQEKFNVLINRDIWIVQCEIGAVKNVDRGVDRSTTTETKYLGVPKRIQVFMDDMEKLLQDHKVCDVNLRVSGKIFPAHKYLLGTRSKVFASMFELDTEESRSGTVTLKDIEIEVVSDLLKYIYSGQLAEMSVDKAIGLYSAADKYALLDLKELCADFLRKSISKENVCAIALVADAHNDGMLIDSIKIFIRENTSVLSSEQWKRFAENNLRLAYEFSMSLNKVLSAISGPSE